MKRLTRRTPTNEKRKAIEKLFRKHRMQPIPKETGEKAPKEAWENAKTKYDEVEKAYKDEIRLKGDYEKTNTKMQVEFEKAKLGLNCEEDYAQLGNVLLPPLPWLCAALRHQLPGHLYQIEVT
jgi:hypothetical protein